MTSLPKFCTELFCLVLLLSVLAVGIMGGMG